MKNHKHYDNQDPGTIVIMVALMIFVAIMLALVAGCDSRDVDAHVNGDTYKTMSNRLETALEESYRINSTLSDTVEDLRQYNSELEAKVLELRATIQRLKEKNNP